ncbi:hypothetical protein EON66_10380 [archaeon]|nr:MAG: hypothetical protein EON66_10380 [archaeon]
MRTVCTHPRAVFSAAAHTSRHMADAEMPLCLLTVACNAYRAVRTTVHGRVLLNGMSPELRAALLDGRGSVALHEVEGKARLLLS